MKIGILTFTQGTNIGQRLQNYAMQEIMRMYADEVYTIRQTSPHSVWSHTKMLIKGVLADLKDPLISAKRRNRNKCFREFNRKNIRFYHKKLSFAGDNAWISKDFDAFISGSDQIWNPRSPDVGDNFFLDFARPDQRFTYAPSFSVEEIPEKDTNLFRERLHGLSDISVREDVGAKIVKGLTGQDATVVLDPTFLLDREKWDRIKEVYPGKKKDYAVTFFLGTTDVKCMANVRELIGKELIEIRPTTSISPAQFLDLVENASVVLTDSYHASVFSTIYHVPFVFFPREGTSVDMNSRFRTLFHKLDLFNREWSYLKDHSAEIYHIDFDHVEKKLASERANSWDYLNRTIGRKTGKSIRL